MPPAPLHEIVDYPRWAGSAGGSAQVFSYRYSAPVVTKLNFVVPVHLCIALLVLGDFYSGLCQASNSWTSVSGASKKSSAGLLCMVPEDVSKPWIWEMWAEHRRQPKNVEGLRLQGVAALFFKAAADGFVAHGWPCQLFCCVFSVWGFGHLWWWSRYIQPWRQQNDFLVF